LIVYAITFVYVHVYVNHRLCSMKRWRSSVEHY